MPQQGEYEHIVNDQVEDLRDRMRLLQGDRKTNIMQMEIKKEENKAIIRRLRIENKELVKQHANILRNKAQAMGDDEDEIKQLTRELKKARKQHDELNHSVKSATGTLEKLKDEVSDLELESRRPNLEDSPQTRKIRTLENRLDKAMIKYNEAESIKKTYEQIAKRLREERVGFDNQLAAIERTLAAKNHDCEELMLLAGDATHAKELTFKDLDRMRSLYDEDRRKRQKELKEKEQVMQVKIDMHERLMSRDQQAQELIAKQASTLSPAEEAQVAASLALKAASAQHHHSKIDIFERAFRKIKEATGVSDVNEVIAKIFSQEGTTENLILVTKENQARVTQITRDILAKKTKVEQLKYNGQGTMHRRKLVDEYEKSLAIGSTKLDRSRSKFERLTKVLLEVKSGIHHLADKLEAMDERKLKQIQQADESTVSLLQEVQQILLHVMTELSNNNNNEASSSGTSVSPAPSSVIEPKILQQSKTEPKLEMVQHIDDHEAMTSRPYNQRIPLPGELNHEDEMDGASELGSSSYQAHQRSGNTKKSGGGHYEEIDDALSRDKVKKASTQILLAQEKKKHRSSKDLAETSATSSSPQKKSNKRF